MSSGCPVRLPARVPLPAKALAGMSRGLSPNLRTMFRASLVERFAIRLLRMGFFAAGRLACVPFAGFAACRSSAARRAAGLARRGVVTSLRFAGSWGADSWGADSWAADSSDADSCRRQLLGRQTLEHEFRWLGLPERGFLCKEFLRHGTLGYGFLGYGFLGYGFLGHRGGVPAFRQRLLSCQMLLNCLVGFRRSRDRATVRGPASCGRRQVASCQAVSIEMQPGLVLAGTGGRIGNLCANVERPLDGGEKQGRHADADNASECNQGGGGYETQMRVQGHLLRKGRPPATPIRGKNIGAMAGLCPFEAPVPSGNRNFV